MDKLLRAVLEGLLFLILLTNDGTDAGRVSAYVRLWKRHVPQPEFEPKYFDLLLSDHKDVHPHQLWSNFNKSALNTKPPQGAYSVGQHDHDKAN